MCRCLTRTVREAYAVHLLSLGMLEVVVGLSIQTDHPRDSQENLILHLYGHLQVWLRQGLTKMPNVVVKESTCRAENFTS